MESFDLTKDLIDSTKPLFIYVSALVILSFSLFRLLYGSSALAILSFSSFRLLYENNDSSFESWITGISAILAFLLFLNLRALDPWLSLAIVIIAAALFILAMIKKPSQKLAIGGLLALFVSVNVLLFWYDYQNNIYGETIRVMLHTRDPKDTKDDLIDQVLWEKNRAIEFTEKFGVKVKSEPAEIDVNKRLKQMQGLLDSQSDSQLENSVDVFAIDVIWPGVFANHAADLNPAFDENSQEEFIDKIIDNNKVDGKLVAVPWYFEAGLLFYRSDLLETYGYFKPPQTWDELEEMAKKIHKGERAKGNTNFWGFVWQSKGYEGLTCNALEWQFSHDGGILIDENNKVDIKDLAAVAAFERAKKWIWDDKISPKIPTDKILEEAGYDESDTLQIWKEGNAAFMRSWSPDYVVFQKRSWFPSDIKVQVTLLPGNGASPRHAATLGGWQLMVNKHSRGKKKKAAIEFVKFLTDHERQKSLAEDTGKIPTLKDLANGKVNDPPFNELPLDKLIDGDPSSIVPRPSTVTGSKYPKISAAYFGKVHKILRNEDSNVQEAVEELRDEVQKLIQP